MKPMIFNTEMTRAILEGRKTVTRRPVKPQEADWEFLGMENDPHMTRIDRNGEEYSSQESGIWAAFEWGAVFRLVKVPYQPGDILYVQEKWAKLYYVDIDGYTHYDQSEYYYAADGTPDITLYDEDGSQLDDQSIRWRSSRCMPKEAARIFLRVTDVRVERLQDITVEGILAGGVDVEIPPICKRSIDPDFPSDRQRNQWEKMTETQREEYVQNLARHTYIGWCDYADRMFSAFLHLWNSTIKDTDLPVYGWDANPYVWVIEFERISREEAVNG